MKNPAPKPIFLKDYQAPPFQVDKVELEFDIHSTETIVYSKLKIRKTRPDCGDLELNGVDLELKSIKLNGEPVTDYELEKEKLVVKKPVLENFELEIETKIEPHKNFSLEGLYYSEGLFSTQNEAEGFRKITYYIDRPDVLAVYTTKIIADKKSCPILLSNGNLIDSGDLGNGRHFATWHDPHPKPCYLYALVAGDLACKQENFTTRSGRQVSLEFYVDSKHLDQVDHAMQSLIKSMKWDEEKYGLEYDLDRYMVVAVESFNAGAMENKGLNIFNTKYVLASPDTATDSDYYGIEAVIGHEYFHNWTGNRVTCRDWFQLTLKEGLTVFREQQFSGDMNSEGVQRVQDVEVLRRFQFEEDAGSFSHPIVPDHYIEINNFYTRTVYEKGSEVIRMVHTLIGDEDFRKGIDRYFELFDGQAVTTDDFLQAMQECTDVSLENFKKWYHTKGTPVVEVSLTSQDKASGVRTYKIKQSADKGTLLTIPLNLKCLGNESSVKLVDSSANSVLRQNNMEEREGLLILEDSETSIEVSGGTLSLNRNFSAPIKIQWDRPIEELVEIGVSETDTFSRWDALNSMVGSIIHKGENSTPYIETLGKVLQENDAHVQGLLWKLPSEEELIEAQKVYDFQQIHERRESLLVQLGETYFDVLIKQIEKINSKTSKEWNGENMGLRTFKYSCMGALAATRKPEARNFLFEQYMQAETMTEEEGALYLINRFQLGDVEGANARFYDRWKKENLVICKWLSAQAMADRSDIFDCLGKLERSEAFNIKVPNDVYALYMRFAMSNLVHFHREDGQGYEFLAERIRDIDKFNQQVASRLSRCFKSLSRLSENQSHLCRQSLEKLIRSDISRNTYEIIERVLKS